MGDPPGGRSISLNVLSDVSIVNKCRIMFTKKNHPGNIISFHDILFFGIDSDQAQTLWTSRPVHYKSAHQVSASHVRMGLIKVRVKIGLFLSKSCFGLQNRSKYFLTSARHMTSGRFVETHCTFQEHTLNALSSSMALWYNGSNVVMVLLLHCFHAVSLPSHGEIS